MSTITATDLIDELTKLKARNEEYRQGHQALVRENRQLRQEVGRANTDLTAATERLAEIEVLQQKLWAAEREAQAAREEVGGLRGRVEKAETARERMSVQVVSQEASLAQTAEDVARWERDHSDLSTELERVRANVESLEPYRDALLTLKRAMKL